MLNIAYTHASVVIFHDYMPQNKQSNRYSLYSMTSVVVLFAYPIKLNISTRKELHKFYQRSCMMILTDLPNSIKKILDKIRFINTLKLVDISCNKLFNFIKSQQVRQNQACCNLSLPDLLQLVKTCSKPVVNKFWQSTCKKSVVVLITRSRHVKGMYSKRILISASI